jgi:hypothetical protein
MLHEDSQRPYLGSLGRFVASRALHERTNEPMLKVVVDSNNASVSCAGFWQIFNRLPHNDATYAKLQLRDLTMALLSSLPRKISNACT